MARAVYTDEDRAAGLAAIDANGGSVAKAAKDTGIPRKTLAYWHKQQNALPTPPIAEVRAANVAKLVGPQKSALASQFGDFAARVLGLTTDNDIKASSLKDRFTAAGIAIDKRELLLGNKTEEPPANLHFHFTLEDLLKLEPHELQRVYRAKISAPPRDQ